MTMFAAISTAISLLLFAGSAAEAAACRDMTFERTSFTVCEADPSVTPIELVLNGANARPLGTFSNLEDALAARGLQPVFAMNAGMYHPDRRPVGLYVEDGVEQARIVTREGPGNFGLLPNGVFCLSGNTASVIESREYADDPPACRYATQSGPMLVIGGKLHPRFLPQSDSRFLRNGVGVTSDGRVMAAISNQPVNFHQFARFFRDVLGTPNALYLDGKVSRLLAPALGRRDIGLPVGPMLVAVRPAD